MITVAKGKSVSQPVSQSVWLLSGGKLSPGSTEFEGDLQKPRVLQCRSERFEMSVPTRKHLTFICQLTLVLQKCHTS